MKNIIYLIFWLIASSPCLAQKVNINKTILWEKGIGNYNNYRIPSIITSKKGTLLAFCEARESGDTGDIDVLMKRSTDNGITWSDESIVWSDGENTCGNPTPVIDNETGRIWLFLTWNHGDDNETQIIHKKSKLPRLPYLSFSDDDGLTWSEPKNMNDSCRNPSWGWYATGPGVGIQIKKGKFKGRLVIPSNHSYDDINGEIRNGPFNYGAHVLFSDNNGSSWEISDSIFPGCNESQIVELENGDLMMNMRSYNNQFSRAYSISNDGGYSWSKIKHDYQLVESKCQASILNYGMFNKKNMYLFSNPAVPVGRTNMTIKTSFDNCKTWINSKVIHSGPSAYSCLTKLPNGNIGIFYEGGKTSAYEKMIFISFKPDALFSDSSF